MVGDLGVGWKWAGRSRQRVCHLAVQGAAGLLAELAIEHLAEQRVNEPAARALRARRGVAARRADHPGAGRLGQARQTHVAS